MISASKDQLPEELRPEHWHTHHAVEQGKLFAKIMTWGGRLPSLPIDAPPAAGVIPAHQIPGLSSGHQ